MLIFKCLFFFSFLSFSFVEELKIEFNKVNIDNFPDIELLFSVRDLLGRPLENLDRKQINLKENANVIDNYFLNIANEPVEMVILIDDSGSMHNFRIYATRAIRAFLKHMQDADKAAILAFSDDIEVLQAMTSNKEDLAKSINKLKGYGATALYDAIYKAAEILNGGNKSVIVLLSDGVDQNKENTDRQSARSAIEAVTITVNKRIRIFSIGLGKQINRQELKDFARLTKGSFYYAPSVNQLEDIYLQVARNIKSDVRIRYTSPNLKKDGLMREVRLEIKKEDRQGSEEIDFLAPGIFLIESNGFGYDIDFGRKNRDSSLKFILKDERGIEKSGQKDFLHSFINQLGK